MKRRMLSKHEEAARERAVAVLDAYERDQARGRRRSLSRYVRRKRTSLSTFTKYVGTRHDDSGHLQPVPPHRRHIDRGTIPILADIHGRPTVVEVRPRNDAQWNAVKGHDAAVFAAVNKGDDSSLPRYRYRVVVDADSGRRYRFYVDGEGIRDATDVGEVELQELFYSGHRSHDLDALFVERTS